MGKGGENKTVMAAHCSHCGGTCLLKLHVEDGVITRIETDDGEEPQYRACARGRAYRQKVYSRDRLLYPMKRVGKRGEGRFERISWDEALDTVAGEMTRVRETYGPASILFRGGFADIGRLQGLMPHFRLLFMAGGCSEVWGVQSFEGALFAQMATFGTVATTSTRDNLLHSRLIILWGFNPADTVLNTNTCWYLIRAREAGARIVSIDPRYTNTASVCNSRWIPIRPSTDTAMLIAMAYVMIKERLYDRRFLHDYTVGFQQFEDYVMGREDAQPKTPQWAEAITGVPASTIEELARDYATVKPAALMTGIGPGRTAYGEQYHRAAATLAAMTGNIGIRGGDAGISAFTGVLGLYPYMRLGPSIPIPPNPVESKAPPRKKSFSSWGGYSLYRLGHINQSKIADAILKGKAGGYPADYKLFYIVGTNYPNQYPNVNKAVEALKSKALEFIVVFEQFITPAARFADILIPVNTCVERNDITTSATLGFYGFMGKAIDSLGESRSHLEICAALAERMGISDYSDKTEEEWLRQIAGGIPQVTDFEAFKKDGGCKIKLEEPYVAFREQIEDIEKHPFPTPSGKIEIYSQRLADMEDPLITPVPKYIEPWEGVMDPLAKNYPLQLITSHSLRRAHSKFENIPWLREIRTQTVLMNSVDAESRGIQNGDPVKVFNDRGVTVLPAEVTERIRPGVVDIQEGAWYMPDENGVDRGGSPNILTKDEPSPGGAYCTNTALVQVAKV